MLRYILTLLICVVSCVTTMASPSSPVLTRTNAHGRIHQWFQEAQQARQADQAAPFRQEIAAGLRAPKLPASKKQSDTLQAGAAKPWQLALFLAMDEDFYKADDLRAPIENKIKQGLVQWAVLFDITQCIDHSDTIRSSCRIPLYFLYKSGSQVVLKTAFYDAQSDYEDLLNQFFSHFKGTGSSLYTGVVFDAHGSGISMSDYDINASQIAWAADKNQLHIDLLELDACHMSSLYSVYYSALWDNIDFMNAPSNITYSTPSSQVPFPLIDFLNHTPKEAARLSVKNRSHLFNWDQGYETTSYASLQLRPLKRPLKAWIDSYVQLRRQADASTEKTLRNLATQGGNWHSLEDLVRTHKTYVKRYFEQLNIPTSVKNEFITTSETLLRTLPQATLTQWCYSEENHQLYTENIPSYQQSGCLGSISVSASQLERIYDIKTEK